MLWAGFVFGLLGSFHCVGMCGAIALALPGQPGSPADRGRWPFLRGRLLYHAGRISTYAGLGALAGLAGHGLRLAGWQQSLSIASGLLILLLIAAPARYSGRLADALGLAALLRWVQATLADLFRRPSGAALYGTGLLNGLLPCGLVYLALAGALSAPGVLGAAAYMACFGLGTLPLLLSLSLTGRLVPVAWRSRLRRVVPYAATTLALLFVVRGLGLGIPYLSPRLQPLAGAPAPAHLPRTVHYCR
ncbi:sulfite exporter TauE/SafE family protein [Hymenobacter rigui]|uniref:Sulfite exporter TauE/SafE family protein n=2 Tax=Hymenobacter rigui TaxID=334424 RepID=A0A3R9MNN1_9BACT|nr:sulfite exporter TauE/SafE family protein [Hymenobacter rigui]